MRRFWSEYKLSVIRGLNSGDLMYSMVTIIDNTVLHTCKLLRVNLRCSHYNNNNKIVIM